MGVNPCTGVVYRYHVQVSCTGIMYRCRVQVSCCTGPSCTLRQTQRQQNTLSYVGYLFSKATEKLKSEYAGLSGREIGALRKDGVQISERVVNPLLAFLGDYESLCQSDRGVSLNYIYDPLTNV